MGSDDSEAEEEATEEVAEEAAEVAPAESEDVEEASEEAVKEEVAEEEPAAEEATEEVKEESAEEATGKDCPIVRTNLLMQSTVQNADLNSDYRGYSQRGQDGHECRQTLLRLHRGNVRAFPPGLTAGGITPLSCQLLAKHPVLAKPSIYLDKIPLVELQV